MYIQSESKFQLSLQKLYSPQRHREHRGGTEKGKPLCILRVLCVCGGEFLSR
jgi:hypothetical protein